MSQLEEALAVIQSIFGSSIVAKVLAALAVIVYSIYFFSSKKLIKKQAEHKIKEKKLDSLSKNQIKNQTEEEALHGAESSLEKYLKERSK